MFEKEAEEYQTEKRKSFNEHEQLCWGDVYKDWKNGAEFGYNKANEWHKVKDEGLPKNNNDGATYLLYTIYGTGGSPVVAHFMHKDKQELMNVWTGAILIEDKIIAWKEVVLPKESE